MLAIIAVSLTAIFISIRYRVRSSVAAVLYLQLAPADHLVLLTRMLVAEFLYGLLDTASYGR